MYGNMYVHHMHVYRHVHICIAPVMSDGSNLERCSEMAMMILSIDHSQFPQTAE